MSRGWALFWGALLVVVGGLALLFNLGLIQAEQLNRVLLLWPLILILIGAEIVLARLAPRRVAVISMTVIVLLVAVGSIGYVLSAPRAQQVHRTFVATDTAGGPATLRVDLGAATISLSTRAMTGQAAEAGLDYSSGLGPAPKFSWDQGSRRLQISRSANGFALGPSTPDRLTVTLNSGVPWTLEFNTGAATITADASGTRVDGLSVNGGAVTLHLRLGAPSGSVHLNVNGGASHVDISRPAGAPIRVEVDGAANSLVADGHRVGSAIGSISWSSAGYPAPDAYSLTINGGANQVTVSQSA